MSDWIADTAQKTFNDCFDEMTSQAGCCVIRLSAASGQHRRALSPKLNPTSVTVSRQLDTRRSEQEGWGRVCVGKRDEWAEQLADCCPTHF